MGFASVLWGIAYFAMMAIVCFPTFLYAHSGRLDGKGCHHSGADYHCHGGNPATPSPTNEISSFSGPVDPAYGKLLLEYLNSHPKDKEPPVNTKSQQDYDRFMSAFNRNRFKESVHQAETSIDEQKCDPSVSPKTITRDEHGRIQRSETAKKAFKLLHPCPSNGNNSGPCPGYVIDHIIPLHKCGADEPFNMQWQTISEGKAKDKWE